MNKKHLTQEHRYTISRMLEAVRTRKDICTAIGKDKSILSRELKRNSHKWGYSPRLTQEYTDERKERFARKRKFTEPVKQEIVKELTEEQWSPEQITGKARRDGIPMVRHERIYQFIREDKRQGGTLYTHLRHRLKHRKRPVGGKKALIPDEVSIDLRPDSINKKKRYGDWVVDIIVGKKNKEAILTVTERKTGFLLMKKLSKEKNAKDLAMEVNFMNTKRLPKC